MNKINKTLIKFYILNLTKNLFYNTYLGDFTEDLNKLDIPKLKTGTTTAALVCKDCVVLGADKKATMGNLVATKKADKVHKIAKNIGMTIAGSVGDAQALIRLLRAESKLYELDEGEIPVSVLSTLLANVLRSAYKSFIPEFVQLLVGGYDSNGPSLYSLDAAGGLSKEEDYAFSGSGSVMAVGVLEDTYKPDMTEEEGIKTIVRAINAARERDVYSGGVSIDVAVIDKNGLRFIDQKTIKKILSEKN